MSSKGIAGLLERIGFREGCIVETILATMNSDGSVNLAPMGVTRRGSLNLEVNPFKTSQTYRNLKQAGPVCINVTSAPELFLQTAFKNVEFKGFRKPKTKGLRLEHSDACVMVEVLKLVDASELQSKALCSVMSVELTNTTPQAFSRGRAEALEAVIHATRIQAFHEQDLSKPLESSVKLFKESCKIVERVSSMDSVEYRVVCELVKLTDAWRSDS